MLTRANIDVAVPSFVTRATRYLHHPPWLPPCSIKPFSFSRPFCCFFLFKKAQMVPVSYWVVWRRASGFYSIGVHSHISGVQAFMFHAEQVSSIDSSFLQYKGSKLYKAIHVETTTAQSDDKVIPLSILTIKDFKRCSPYMLST